MQKSIIDTYASEMKAVTYKIELGSEVDPAKFLITRTRTILSSKAFTITRRTQRHRAVCLGSICSENWIFEVFKQQKFFSAIITIGHAKPKQTRRLENIGTSWISHHSIKPILRLKMPFLQTTLVFQWNAHTKQWTVYDNHSAAGSRNLIPAESLVQKTAPLEPNKPYLIYPMTPMNTTLNLPDTYVAGAIDDLLGAAKLAQWSMGDRETRSTIESELRKELSSRIGTPFEGVLRGSEFETAL